MDTTKKKLAVLLLGAILALASAGCTSTTSPSSDEPGNAQVDVQKDNSSGELGDYAIEIGDYFLTKTYEGKDAIVINMKYTNNAEEAKNYMTTLTGSAFQDGVELSTAIIMDGSYDAESQMKDIKTGASIDVQVAYELSNTTSDVEFEIEEFISFSDKKIEKVFELAE